ncbi:Coenzyme Q-binding protein coq10a, mitochondrial [Coemansia javaensis]|uniref:Coenzyme Q-binding protein coq10a, mitochondrial n=1 Tax=Coemansia javaensis TaxID=2761396 RepID=A0A9W8HJD8_9FUNG|nr:Coenzyme Q-binding protein coq10a, mitochondrial [Coemansia javaensis]
MNSLLRAGCLRSGARRHQHQHQHQHQQWQRRRVSTAQRFQESRVFPYSAAQVFDLVADVGRYSEFVPMCTGSTVFHDTWRTGAAGGRRSVRAELAVGYAPFRERYTSVVELDRPRRITATATPGGVFTHMRTVWDFADAPPPGPAASPFARPSATAASAASATRVSFAIEYQFASALHAAVAGPVFSTMAQSILAAYLARCQALYGR